MVHITTSLVILKTLTLVLGGLIAYYAYQAYTRTRARPLGLLALGFGVVTFGALVAGIIERLTSLDPMLAITVESALTVVGFAVILYSLYAR